MTNGGELTRYQSIDSYPKGKSVNQVSVKSVIEVVHKQATRVSHFVHAENGGDLPSAVKGLATSGSDLA